MPPASPPPCAAPSENALFSLNVPCPGIGTHESRGNEIIVALPPPAGMCSTIIESVFVAPPSSVVPSSASSWGVASAGRWSSPTSRMFCAAPSASAPGVDDACGSATCTFVRLSSSCAYDHAA